MFKIYNEKGKPEAKPVLLALTRVFSPTYPPQGRIRLTVVTEDGSNACSRPWLLTFRENGSVGYCNGINAPGIQTERDGRIKLDN